ncbi:MAG: sigma-70 family RNA polymerase sigma factor [Planctomycetes bacterium]|jgi:RNA polymerase sigma factor (sigma-70 family)|nr:sigma-70 family RNA polymerase sigma factor [Planctomycetota bacterium]
MQKSTAPSTDELLAHVPFVRGLAFALVGEAADADDITQETLLRVIERPPRVLTSLRAFLTGVVSNVARMHWRGKGRRRRREALAAAAAAAPSAADSAEKVEILRRVTTAVAETAEPYRTVLLLRYYEGLRPAEIARRTGDPVKTVKTRLYRALAALRSRLDEEHGGRRAWALALLPLAGRDAAAPSPRIRPRVAFGMAAGTVMLILCAVLFHGSPAAGPAPPPPDPVVMEIASEPDSGLPEGPPPAPPSTAGAEPTPAVPDAALLVSVVDAETGVAIPWVAVFRHDLANGPLVDTGDEDATSSWISDALEDHQRTAGTRTGADGRAPLDAPPGAYLLFVRHPRYRDLVGERILVRAGETTEVVLRLTPYPEEEREVTFAGSVTDGETATPLSGVAVVARYHDGREVVMADARTEMDGRYALRLPANAPVALRYSKEGFEPHDLAVNPVEMPWITGDVSILRIGGGPRRGEARLTGRVIDGATGQPLAGAKLSLSREIGDWVGWESAADGTYRIDLKTVDNVEEHLRLVVRADGYTTHTSGPIALAPDRTIEYAVALPREGSTTGFGGRIADSGSGAPLPGARIEAEDLFGALLGAAVTGADGRYFLPARGGEHRIVARAEGHASVSADVAEPPAPGCGETRTVDFALPRADARIIGSLTDEATKAPLAGVTVTILLAPEWGSPGPSTVTGRDGAYSLDVPAGRYVVEASIDGYGTGFAGPLDAAAGEETRADLRLAAADCELLGRVRDAMTGEELPAGAETLLVHRVPAHEAEELECRLANRKRPLRIETNGAAFRVRLAPGRYEVLVTLPDRAISGRVVDLRAGERVETDIEVSPR